MDKIYSTAKVCLSNGTCWDLEPGMVLVPLLPMAMGLSWSSPAGWGWQIVPMFIKIVLGQGWIFRFGMRLVATLQRYCRIMELQNSLG